MVDWAEPSVFSPKMPIRLVRFMKTGCILSVLLAALVVGCGERQPPATTRTAKVDFQPDVAPASNGQRETLPEPVKPKVKTELETLQDRAEHGDDEAQLQLGVRFFYGDGVEKDRAQATAWLRKAAESGNPKAQFNLGKVMYSQGLAAQGPSLQGEPSGPQKAEAAKWFQKAADQGHAESQVQLAVIYQTGDGVGRSMEKAIELYRQAAEKENATAQFLLGEIYLNGDEVPQDFSKGNKLLIQAAVQGYEPALVRSSFIDQSLRKPDAVVEVNTPDVLRGLSGVCVGVEQLAPEVEKVGLTTNRIQTAVELRLRTLGIQVVSYEARRGSEYRTSWPTLYVRLHGRKVIDIPALIFVVTVRLDVNVLSERKHYQTIIGANVWDRELMSGAGEAVVADIALKKIQELIDEFANDFLTANPKK